MAFIHGDVCDSSLVKKTVDSCEYVVHFHAETHVDRSIVEDGTFVTTDVCGTFALLEATRRSGVDRFTHISTDEVYGELGGRPCPEGCAPKPEVSLRRQQD